MSQRLSRDLLEQQLEALDLCSSLFPQEGELSLSEETERFIPELRDWLEEGTTSSTRGGSQQEAPRIWENELAFTFNLSLEPRTESLASQSYPISLSVRLPTLDTGEHSASTPPATCNLVHPSWLPRSSYDTLSSSLPAYDPSTFTSNTEFILSMIDHVRDHGPDYIPQESEREDEASKNGVNGTGKKGKRQKAASDDDPEFRVWLWFPSLSTREKRDDIVNWASDYDLTGFVLAGKPAVMCLEGTENNIQEYMAEIKSKSWADIPSFQKKVSERYRTPLISPTTSSSPNDPSSRIFRNMSEITKLIGQSGQKGNRGDMGEVRDFLAGKGLAEAFGVVIGGGHFS
ncbi:hypothetical protein JCM16303_006586 [Sporobolomyces ruberrimus]